MIETITLNLKTKKNERRREKREKGTKKKNKKRRKKDFDTFKNESLPLVYKLVNVGVTDPCA
jgi:hypothetical protein|tara:strand:- start:185 stop:370 length:186 start_codon:yes stop_codon:yes gene_type:complete